MKISDSWNVINEFLREVFPEKYRSLGKGADSREIEGLEQKIGQPIPDSLKDFLIAHNGQVLDRESEFIFSTTNLYNCGRIASEYAMAVEIFNEIGPGDESNYASDGKIRSDLGWSDGWIPFAGFQGCHVVLDLDPGKDGIYGQVFEAEYQVAGKVLSNSLDEWLEEYVKIIENGKYIGINNNDEDDGFNQFHFQLRNDG
jgi:cell wall assembly regulator SMI1